MQYDIKSLLNEMHGAVYFVNRDRRIIFWNQAAEKITGFTALEVVGRECSDNILAHVDEKGVSLCKSLCPLLGAIRDGIPTEFETYLRHKDGYRVPVSGRAAPLRDKDGNIVGGVEMFSDISSKQKLQNRLKDLEDFALLDQLTGLSNRHHIESEVEIRFHERNRNGLDFGILFMNVDHFKKINDTFGHEVGDRVLRLVADTLRATARPFDLFGRRGGDEFLGIIRDVNLESLVKVGERCRVLTEKSYISVDDRFVNATISVGATVSKPGDDAATIVKRAVELLYQSKEKGRNCLTAG